MFDGRKGWGWPRRGRSGGARSPIRRATTIVSGSAGAYIPRDSSRERATLSDQFDLSGLVDEFRDEARGQLEQLDAALQKLERDGALPADERAALLRGLHTLKGNSGMLGFVPIRDFVHAVESVLRSESEAWPRPLLDRLFEGSAALRRAIEQVGTDDEARAASRLTALLPLDAGVDREEPAGPTAAAEEPPARDADSDRESSGGQAELLRVPFLKLDLLANQVAELFGIHAALDDLLVTHRDTLRAADLQRPLQTRLEQLERVAGALRGTATDLRLVPVGRVFNRFPSLARDLARERGKRVRVLVEGEETELDKSTVDVLAEPLLHLVRNAVDHGIGTPEERVARGQDEQGTITLRARQIGDTVQIEVEDDGGGLDRRRILERARAGGLVGLEETVSEEEIASLILRHGFSTRAEADAVSGRGIGLDVVASTAARLRGSLAVEDGAEGGTRFILRLPLTVAIVPALLFRCGEETLALPALEVEDAYLVDRVGRVAGAEVVRYGDEMIPLARLDRLFAWSRAGAGEAPPPRYAVVVRRGTSATAVAADRLIDQRDVVVKALPSYLGQPRGVSGATIAPDGRVVLLLDSAGVIDLNLESHRRSARA